MKCIIIDDEQLARDLVESYIQKLPKVNLLGKFKNAIEAQVIVNSGSVDLIITDIQMPELLGTDFIKSIKKPPLVIFTTAYQNYAIEGFELKAVDYLLKPFSFDRFETAIQKALELYELKESSFNKAHFKKGYLTVKADHRLYKIKYEDIKYIEGMREYVSFHIETGRITALMSLKSLEEQLPSPDFIRCHKSFIVNTKLVSAMEGNSLLLNDKTIPVGQSYKDQVIEKIF